MDKEYTDRAQTPEEKLAFEHWKFIEDTLKAYDIKAEHELIKAKHMYISAFIHGYKHRKEEDNFKRLKIDRMIIPGLKT